jgi:hypothetical protein
MSIPVIFDCKRPSCTDGRVTSSGGAPRRCARRRRDVFALGILSLGALAACDDRRIIFCSPEQRQANGSCAAAAVGGAGGGSGGSAGSGGAGGRFALGGMGGGAGLGGGGLGGIGGAGGNGPLDGSSGEDAGSDAGDSADAAVTP